ncbi:hypothetical protein E2542_SST03201 [Spatholobus suberectus]|nr:hypothetical protein E2542_SST03201 [Spatholobus suberectus]
MCLAAIAPSPNATDPEAILALSLHSSIHALQNLTSLLETTKGHALADCKDQLDDALSQIHTIRVCCGNLRKPLNKGVKVFPTGY